MLALLQARYRSALMPMEIRETPRAPMPTAAPAARPAAQAAAVVSAPAAPPADTGAAVKDSFKAAAAPKPTQQAGLINPITVAKLSFNSPGKELPKELLANVSNHVKDTQKKVSSLIPKQTAAPAKKAGQKKGGRGGGKGKGKAGTLFDDGAES